MPNSSGNIRYCNSLWPVMFVQDITDDFAERFALMICSFYAPGQGFVSLAELYKHSVHSKHDIYSKLEKKLLFLLFNLTTLKSEEEELIT